MQRSVLVIVVVFVMIIIVALVYALKLGISFLSTDRVVNTARCSSEQVAYGQAINGIVIKKFSDSRNHIWKAVLVQEKGVSKVSPVFHNESGYTYDSIEVGDSLYKEPYSLVLVRFRGKTKKTFRLDYGCEKDR